jgi:pectin methylesterase-like acyl-CoA thioesterase
MNHDWLYPAKKLGVRRSLAALSLTTALAFAASAHAATLCVNQHTTPGCVATISAAVAAAAPGDTITVAPGTYREDVVIGQPLSLIGADRETTIIDAMSLSNGVYVDGFDHPGLS